MSKLAPGVKRRDFNENKGDLEGGMGDRNQPSRDVSLDSG